MKRMFTVSLVCLVLSMFVFILIPMCILFYSIFWVDKSEPMVYNEPKVEETIVEEIEDYIVRTMLVTAYTVGDGYTPGTIMANGQEVFVGAVACNDYPLGTKIHIDGNEYVVADRMLEDGKVDIYMDSYEDCMNWGVREKEVKIYVQ